MTAERFNSLVQTAIKTRVSDIAPFLGLLSEETKTLLCEDTIAGDARSRLEGMVEILAVLEGKLEIAP